MKELSSEKDVQNLSILRESLHFYDINLNHDVDFTINIVSKAAM